MTLALSILVAMVGVSQLNSYRADGFFLDSFGRRVDFKETWVRDKGLSVDFKVASRTLAHLQVDAVACECKLFNHALKTVTSCEAAWVVANSPIRRALGGGIGDRWTRTPPVPPGERLQLLVKEIGRARQRVALVMESDTRADSTELLRADVIVGDGSVSLPAQAGGDGYARGEPSADHAWLSNSWYVAGIAACGSVDDRVVGLRTEWKEKFLHVIDVYECSATHSLGLKSGDYLAAVDEAPQLDACTTQSSRYYISSGPQIGSHASDARIVTLEPDVAPAVLVRKKHLGLRN